MDRELNFENVLVQLSEVWLALQHETDGVKRSLSTILSDEFIKQRGLTERLKSGSKKCFQIQHQRYRDKIITVSESVSV